MSVLSCGQPNKARFVADLPRTLQPQSDVSGANAEMLSIFQQYDSNKDMRWSFVEYMEFLNATNNYSLSLRVRFFSYESTTG